jgi:hypothetical protein
MTSILKKAGMVVIIIITKKSDYVILSLCNII